MIYNVLSFLFCAFQEARCCVETALRPVMVRGSR